MVATYKTWTVTDDGMRQGDRFEHEGKTFTVSRPVMSPDGSSGNDGPGICPVYVSEQEEPIWLKKYSNIEVERLPWKLAEGKTKIIWEHPDSSSRVRERVMIESKNDITAGDGASRDLLEDKAVNATRTTCNVFELIDPHVLTHYLGPDDSDPTVFHALKAEMLPMEWVARRIATGSYLKRNREVAEGTVLAPLVVECFLKDDERHDPLMIWDFVGWRYLLYEAGKPLGVGYIEEKPILPVRAQQTIDETVEMVRTTVKVFEVIEDAWRQQEVQLVDLKIEFGRLHDGRLAVADVIDNDSWRIWPGGDKAQMKDKQVYRDLAGVDDPAAKAKELGKIKQNYAEVAEMTSKFKRS